MSGEVSPGVRHLWRVGGNRVELATGPRGWVAHVRCSVWGEEELVVDDTFVDEAQALAWCVRMAHALACDLESESGLHQPWS